MTRRGFLGRTGAAALAAGVGGWSAAPRDAQASEAASAAQRRNDAYRIRHQAAVVHRNAPATPHLANGDDDLYAARIASFSKTLPHDSLGQVDLAAYGALLRAVEGGRFDDFERVPMGGAARLVNPQGAFTFALEGADSHDVAMPAPPAFASAWEAGEMVEVYWQALTRDVAFADFGSDPMAAAACADLSRLSDFRGPKEGGGVTPETLFRASTPGDLAGPYLSQFLWRDVPYGPTSIVQRYRTPVPGDDHMKSWDEWLRIQNGGSPLRAEQLDPQPRYLRNGRDLAAWVHRDFTYQGFLNAALILLSLGPGALDRGNPYLRSASQAAFITFGGPDVLDLVGRVANAALRAAWCQKWLVHRRLRPEAFAGRVEAQLSGRARYPIHADVLGSEAVSETRRRFGTALLPMAYPEGSPAHPAYPAGHAAIAGACTTVLKVFFDEDFVLPKPVVVRFDGLALDPYSGPALSVGGELNKLASNVALGRDIAGVHWRTDGIEGLALGEAVALGILRDLKATYTDPGPGLSLTTFAGERIVV